MSLTLREIVQIKIKSVYIVEQEKKNQLLAYIEKMSEEDLKLLDKKLDIILEKIWKLTEKLVEKFN